MKSNRNSVFSFCIIAVYVIAVASFITVLFTEHHKGSERTDIRFNNISRDLSRVIRNNEIESKEFFDSFLTALGNVDDIFSIQLKHEGKLILSYPSDFHSDSNNTSSLLRTKSTDLYSNDGSILQLSCTMYLLKPGTIFLAGSITFLTILAAALACLLYLLMFSSYNDEDEETEETLLTEIDTSVPSLEKTLEKKASETEAKETEKPAEKKAVEEKAVEEKTVEEKSAESKTFEEEPSETQTIAPKTFETKTEEAVKSQEETVILSEPEVLPVTETKPSLSSAEKKLEEEGYVLHKESIAQEEKISLEPVEKEAEAVKEKTEQKEEPEIIPETKNEPVKAEAEKPLVSEEVSQVIPEGLSAEQEPVGLFSPKTGFGWESYMIPRLDKELIRAASSEQDLALFTVRIPDVNWGNECAKKIISHVMETVQFDDLVFEYQEDGFIAIMQEIDTDRAIQIAEQLLTSVLALRKEYKETELMFIGISTRSLRLISGSRLSNESEQALFRAEGDKDNPIVAFRVNPEKYRNYLAGNK